MTAGAVLSQDMLCGMTTKFLGSHEGWYGTETGFRLEWALSSHARGSNCERRRSDVKERVT